jgi:hypothetical protein
MTEQILKQVAWVLGQESEDEEFLAAQLLERHGSDALSKGVHHIQHTSVLWAVRSVEPVELVTRIYAEDGEVWAVWEAPQPDPRPDILAAGERFPMRRLGTTDLWVYARELPNFSATAFRFEAEARPFGDSWVVLEDFEPEPDCLPRPGVPQGTVTEYEPVGSDVFPGTLRGYWLYVPAQVAEGGEPAALMVFQDGGMYLSPQSPVPTVLDNLIARGEMPVTVALFVNPGSFPDQQGRFQNRMAEYHDFRAWKGWCRCAAMPPGARLPESRRAASARSMRRGRCPISSVRCSLTAAVSRTSTGRTTPGPRCGWQSASRCGSGFNRAATISTTYAAVGHWRTGNWRRR